MTPKPKVLTPKQREFYFENGYIILQRLLSDEWIARLRHAKIWSTSAAASHDRLQAGC
jgi:hypothetical protein